jgi:hypothetical protein
MGLFRRRPTDGTVIPESYLRGLREYGEHLVGARGQFNSDLLTDLAMMDLAEEDPDAFVEHLLADIHNGPAHISQYAGACCLGAAEVVAVVHRLNVATPEWCRLLDEAIDYLRRQRVPYDRLKPYLKAHWVRAHDPGTW